MCSVLNVFVFKEPLGRSAFMAIGAGLGTWIGGMIGSLVPFAGTAIGMFLGGAGGDLLGGLIYDGIFSGKEKKENGESSTTPENGEKGKPLSLHGR